MSNIIIHVPHSSLNVPKFFYKRLLIDKNTFNKENIYISDYLIDKLIPTNAEHIIKAEYSRLFMDVERFKNDNLESMSNYGMGVLYEKESNGIKFVDINKKYKNRILRKYYDPYHKYLDDYATKIIEEYGSCIIIDLHSYSDEFVDKMFGYKDCPDICIGVTEGYEDIELTKKVVDKFAYYGYSIQMNYPYSGTIIPNKYFKSNSGNLSSIMIEINKRTYLDNNETLNIEKYNRLHKCIDELYDTIRR